MFKLTPKMSSRMLAGVFFAIAIVFAGDIVFSYFIKPFI